MAYERYNENTPRIRGVLFDMDGLVMDTEKLFCRFWAEAAQAHGFPMTFEQALGMRALSSAAGEAKIQSYFGPTASYRAIRQTRIQLMDAHIAKYGVETKPGIRQLLDYLQANGIRTAITSSSPLSRIQQYLSQHGLDTRFDKLCSGHNVPNGKPAPDIYLYGAASLGLGPAACLALEDAPAGIESAYRAGCHPVLIPDLDTPGEETLTKCFAKADSLRDIMDLLNDLQDRRGR